MGLTARKRKHLRRERKLREKEYAKKVACMLGGHRWINVDEVPAYWTPRRICLECNLVDYDFET